MKGSKKQPAGSDITVPGVDLGQLERLLSFMSEHGLEEFEYAHGDLRIRLKKAIPQPSARRPFWRFLWRRQPLRKSSWRSLRAIAPQAPAAAAGTASAPPPPAPAADEHIIKSPIVGTFYAGPSPGGRAVCSRGRFRRGRADGMHHRSHEIDERD